MNWFYADNGQQKGPVPEFEFASLIKSGLIKASTPVWREGMGEWQPLSLVRPDLLAASNAPSIGGFAVPEHHKDLLVQQMREGVLVETPQPGLMQYVGFWWRVLARIIDTIVMWVAQQVIQLAMFGVLMGGELWKGQSKGAVPDAAAIAVVIGFIGLTLGMQAFYYVWMVGKFGGTLGKMAIGAKIVREDGQPISYLRAFGRWLADGFLNGMIWATITIVPIMIVMAVAFGGFDAMQKDNSSATIGMFAALFGVGTVFGLVGAFPWWMCGFDKEKRGLHDRICATRVIKK